MTSVVTEPGPSTKVKREKERERERDGEARRGIHRKKDVDHFGIDETAHLRDI